MPEPITLTTAEFERLKPLLYHRIAPGTALATQMDNLRTEGIRLAVHILRTTKPSRSQSLALTQLEEAQMRAIQALALEAEPILPPGITVED